MAEMTRDEIVGALTLSNKLQRKNLTELDLQGIDFKRVNFEGSNLSGSNLTGCRMAEAMLVRVDLSDCRLSGADLTGADLRSANLRKADLSGADLTGALLQRADFRSADLSQAILADANLEDANLSRAKLAITDLRGANLTKAILKEANLRGALFRGANLAGAQLDGALGMEALPETGALPVKPMEPKAPPPARTASGVPTQMGTDLQLKGTVATPMPRTIELAEPAPAAPRATSRSLRPAEEPAPAPAAIPSAPRVHRQKTPKAGGKYHPPLKHIQALIFTTAGWIRGTFHVPVMHGFMDYLQRSGELLKLTDVTLPHLKKQLDFFGLRRISALMIIPDCEEELLSLPLITGKNDTFTASFLMESGSVTGNVTIEADIRISDYLNQSRFLVLRECIVGSHGGGAGKGQSARFPLLILNSHGIIGTSEEPLNV
ncbi:MAG: pentapeptide repeat-containing protein [Holophagaceae bacterium]|nr:pentapeptide repeat-containing protein [Holophagaceae bacterium]